MGEVRSIGKGKRATKSLGSQLHYHKLFYKKHKIKKIHVMVFLSCSYQICTEDVS